MQCAPTCQEIIAANPGALCSPSFYCSEIVPLGAKFEQTLRIHSEDRFRSSSASTKVASKIQQWALR